ncbi:heterokaryon incompatibility protein 6, OR allele, partial [Podospora australis]
MHHHPSSSHIMASAPVSPYKPLPNASTIRTLLLAPGNPDDEICCWLIPADLDADHDVFPHTTGPERPFTWAYPFTVKAPTPDEPDRAEVFNLEIDCIFAPTEDDPGMIALPRHPFQRYTALSYVWGSYEEENPFYIILNGEIRFPVTRNLHAALHALRTDCDWSGRMLWVDAVCINQADHVEKEGQLRLMQRVYRQAEQVVAYVPQEVEDQRNLAELLNKIQDAYDSYRKYKDERNLVPEGEAGVALAEDLDGESVMIPFAIPKVGDDGRELSFYEGFAIAQQQVLEYNKRKPEEVARFVEDFGLPPTNSPLWTSWRRLFASPYFRRIWILQEFALAPDLKLQLGVHVSFDVSALILAKEYLTTSSGIQNATYLGHSAPGDRENLSTDAVSGARGFDAMTMERAYQTIKRKEMESRSGSKNGGNLGHDIHMFRGENLVNKLNTARKFKATDHRDKIYAVMGLASDGNDTAWGELVSYAPEVTPAEVYKRFARAMVQRGEGFELLLQAGMGLGEEDEGLLPSWVPNWSSEIGPSGEARRASVPVVSSSIQLDDDNNCLLISGKSTDEIEVLSERTFVNPGAREMTGVKMEDFDAALWQGAHVVFRSFMLQDRNGESGQALVEKMFNNLLMAVTTSDDLFDILVQEDDTEKKASLRKGFDSYMKMKKQLLSYQIKETPDEEIPRLAPIDHPQEIHSFLKQAVGNVWGTKLCSTKEGRIGLVPERTEVGDRVVMFEGCDVAFVLRKLDGSEHARSHYRLVGHAYFCRKGDERHAYSEDEGEAGVITLH